jgi:hypothetical protein
MTEVRDVLERGYGAFHPEPLGQRHGAERCIRDRCLGGGWRALVLAVAHVGATGGSARSRFRWEAILSSPPSRIKGQEPGGATGLRVGLASELEVGGRWARRPHAPNGGAPSRRPKRSERAVRRTEHVEHGGACPHEYPGGFPSRVLVCPKTDCGCLAGGLALEDVPVDIRTTGHLRLG